MSGSYADMAPDGGPKTSIAQSMGMRGVRVLEVVRVRSKINGAEYVINKTDYHPAEHELLKDTVPVRGVQTDGENKTPVELSAFTRTDLAAFTVEALHALPEWRLVQNKGTLNTKDKVIDAILLARAAALAEVTKN